MPPNPLKEEQNIQGDEFNLSPFFCDNCSYVSKAFILDIYYT